MVPMNAAKKKTYRPTRIILNTPPYMQDSFSIFGLILFFMFASPDSYSRGSYLIIFAFHFDVELFG